MYEKLEVDKNLYHLENVLFDLDSYKFDADIIKILNDLKFLVDKKIYSNFNQNGYDIIDEKIIIEFLLKKI